MTPQQIRTDIEKVTALLRELGAASPHLWRPPWGNWLVGTTCELASERGLEPAGWTIDTTDYNGTSASVMHRAAVAELDEADRSGSDTVVLMHDSPLEPGQWKRRRDVDETVELVRRLIADESRRFVPLSQGLLTNLVPTSSPA
jgi:peptidoglycan/xylan/chitin deacetylase (PgdA/CDA1 family)